ncbi:MAG: DnaB-like helicase C-terminal domain-containing protein [Clostridia bacterium]|nr:DnaB-like helicase C-terminal domain-containing protein [Clostridia bacterium]
MKTEIKELDNIVDLEKSKIIFIGGQVSAGKTTLALEIIKNVGINQNIPVLLFSLGLSKEIIVKRIIENSAMVDNKIVNDKILKLSNVPINISDETNITIDYIKEKCRDLKERKNIKLVVIDYIQLTQQNNVNISKELKALAEELDITIIIFSQLQKGDENSVEKRPILKDLKNSEQFIENANVMMFLYKNKEKSELIVVKNDYGNTATIEL